MSSSASDFVRFTRAEALLFSEVLSLLDDVPSSPERLVEALQRLPSSEVGSKMELSAPRQGVFLSLLVKLSEMTDVEMKMIKDGVHFLRVPGHASFVLSQAPGAESETKSRPGGNSQLSNL
jgi:hypothetical protein